MQSTEVSVIIDQMITVQLRNHVLRFPGTAQSNRPAPFKKDIILMAEE